ncbi:MAG: cation transporter [Bryobacteraceae bacterium]
MTNAVAVDHHAFIERGKKLEYFTLVWCGLEALVGVVAGFIAGSVSLTGFGLDSLIEVTSAAALFWRFHRDSKISSPEKVERNKLRIVGFCFLALAAYITCDSASSLIQHEHPEKIIVGVILAVSSVVVMPPVASAKRRIANAIGSGAMNADARQADFCSYLSAILLSGFSTQLRSLVGRGAGGVVHGSDHCKEGIDGVRAKSCCRCESGC